MATRSPSSSYIKDSISCLSVLVTGLDAVTRSHLVRCVGRSKAFPGRGGRGSPGTKIRRFVHKGWNGLGTVSRGGNARAGTVPRGGNARAGTVPRGGTEPNPFHPLGTNRRIVV